MIKVQRSNIIPKTNRISEPIQNSPFFSPNDVQKRRTRFVNGSPFVNTGDYKTNSPNELGFAENQIIASPLLNDVWQCFPANTPIVNVNENDVGLPENQDKFMYWFSKYHLTKNKAIGAICRLFMNTQVAEPTCNFGDATKFPFGGLTDSAPVKDICGWLVRLLDSFTKSYDLYSPTERQLIEEFFFKAGVYWMDGHVQFDLLGVNFNTYEIGNWVLKPSLVTNIRQGLTHFGGNDIYRPTIFNNRRLMAKMAFEMIGVTLNYFGHNIRPSQVGLTTTAQVNAKIQEMISNGEKFTKSYIVFGTFPDNTCVEMRRGAEDSNEKLNSSTGLLEQNLPFDDTQWQSGFTYFMIAMAVLSRGEMIRKRCGLTHALDWTTDLIYNPIPKTVTQQNGVVKGIKPCIDKLRRMYLKTEAEIYARITNNPPLEAQQVHDGILNVNNKNAFRHFAWFAEANEGHWNDTDLRNLYQGNVGGFGFPTDANSFTSGQFRSQSGPHGQTDFEFFNWVD